MLKCKQSADFNPYTQVDKWRLYYYHYSNREYLFARACLLNSSMIIAFSDIQNYEQLITYIL